MRRVLGVVAMAAALAVVLSGCSLWQDGEKVVGQVQQGIAARQLLDELAGELRERDDVESIDSNVAPVYMTASVTVRLRAGAQAKAIGDVAIRVDEVLRSAELQPFEREFSVQAGDAGIRQTSFDGAPVDYAAELAYWGAIQSAVGTGLTLTLGADRSGAFQRILSTRTDATVVAIADHYDAITALEPPDGTDTIWRLPGFAGHTDWLGTLPDTKILTFLATMAGFTNLLDDSVPELPPGVYMFMAGEGQHFPPQFTFVAPETTTHEEVDTNWRFGLRMAREALATGLPALQIAIQTFGNELDEDSYIHLGECVELMPPSSADLKLVADLVASGVDIPITAAGHCIGFATP
jgi:hypothetical protein